MEAWGLRTSSKKSEDGSQRLDYDQNYMSLESVSSDHDWSRLGNFNRCREQHLSGLRNIVFVETRLQDFMVKEVKAGLYLLWPMLFYDTTIKNVRKRKQSFKKVAFFRRKKLFQIKRDLLSFNANERVRAFQNSNYFSS